MMSQKLNVKPLLKTTESWMESILFSSRWILAPFYVGLAFSLIVLLIKFASELIHIATHAFTATESEVILGVLALIDLTLTGSLIIIVIFSGYENFVSRIDHGDHADWPEWMGKIDFSGLKLKLLSSIVAISAIQLLKQFMSISKVSDRDIMWLVIVHVVFVVSSVLLALSDRLTVHNDGHAKKPGGGSGGGKDHKPHAGTDGHGDAGTPVQPATTATTLSPSASHGPAEGPSAAASPRPHANIAMTRIDINRTRGRAPEAVKLAAATAKPCDPIATDERTDPDDEPHGERRPTIKRRLH